jgi:L-alanine-DL-glutamate epimerase-like enolase superfamily enzyme
MMKIKNIRSHLVQVPLPRAHWVGSGVFFAASIVLVEVETDDGIVGLATVHGEQAKAACAILDALQDFLRGRDTLAHEAIWRDVFSITTTPRSPDERKANSTLFSATNRNGLLMALAGIDIALWDIKGKVANKSIWRLLGGERNIIPAYVTCGYYQSGRDHFDLANEMESYLEQGFNAVKIKVGGIALEDDLKRVAVVRKVIGPSTKLMLDANGAYSLSEAEEAIRRFSEFDLVWFEEPLHWYDSVRSLGTLAQRTHVPLASGESEVHAWACRDIADLGGVRYMQFDATLAGGVTEWLRVAAYCHLRGVSMSTHHAPHIQGHLVTAVPNGWNSECFPNPDRDPIWPSMYAYRAELKGGNVVLNDRPGFGFDINWDFVKKYRAS